MKERRNLNKRQYQREKKKFKYGTIWKREEEIWIRNDMKQRRWWWGWWWIWLR